MNISSIFAPIRIASWVGAGMVVMWLILLLVVTPAHAVAPAQQSPLATPQQARSQNLIPTPTPTATVTFAAYQVSPLRIDGGERPLLAAGGSAIWIGAAALLLLGGSVVLVLTSRR